MAMFRSTSGANAAHKHYERHRFLHLATNSKSALGLEENESFTPQKTSAAATIITCMDARLPALGPALGLGGNCHCIRNAGGRASNDALLSVTFAQQMLGARDVYVIHHTNCAMLNCDNNFIHEAIRSTMDIDASEIDFLPIKDLEQSVREDVAAVRSFALTLPGTVVHGGIYDLKTGKVRILEALSDS